jgi:hypothetical protein
MGIGLLVEEWRCIPDGGRADGLGEQAPRAGSECDLLDELPRAALDVAALEPLKHRLDRGLNLGE